MCSMCFRITLINTQLHDRFHIHLLLYHGAKFIYVIIQLALLKIVLTVLLYLPSKKQGNIALKLETLKFIKY